MSISTVVYIGVGSNLWENYVRHVLSSHLLSMVDNAPRRPLLTYYYVGHHYFLPNNLAIRGLIKEVSRCTKLRNPAKTKRTCCRNKQRNIDRSWTASWLLRQAATITECSALDQFLSTMCRPDELVTASKNAHKVHHEGSAVCGAYTYEVAESKAAKVTRYSRENGHPE